MPFDSLDDINVIVDLLVYYLENEVERARIALGGHQRMKDYFEKIDLGLALINGRGRRFMSKSLSSMVPLKLRDGNPPTLDNPLMKYIE